jgi:hypothetical protein
LIKKIPIERRKKDKRWEFLKKKLFGIVIKLNPTGQP